jgi:hypothetical protein
MTPTGGTSDARTQLSGPTPWTNDKGWIQPKSDIHNKALHHLLTTAAAGRGCSPLRRSNPDRVRLAAARSDGNPSAALHVLDVAHTYFGGYRGARGPPLPPPCGNPRRPLARRHRLMTMS